MLRILDRVFAEAYAVANSGKGTNDQVGVPPERVVTRLRGLFSVSSSEFTANLSTAD
jgi:hypothetical protein